MKYPRHMKDRRAILMQEEIRDRDLTEDDVAEMQQRKEFVDITPDPATLTEILSRTRPTQ